MTYAVFLVASLIASAVAYHCGYKRGLIRGVQVGRWPRAPCLRQWRDEADRWLPWLRGLDEAIDELQE